MGKKAVFLDRDGTIIKDKHYLRDPDQVEFFPDTFEALRLMQEKGFRLFIVTNQSGIGRGYFDLADMQKTHKKILSDLKKEGVEIDDLAYCPHAPDERCPCRKPLPKMIVDLINKHNINGKAYMAGDKILDAQAGENAGIVGALVYQAPGDELNSDTARHPRFKNLLAFAKSLPEN